MTTERESASPASDREESRWSESPVSALLGRLYLEQGHLEDAEAVFRIVLSRNDSDPGATKGLEAVRRARAESAVTPARGSSDGGAHAATVAPGSPVDERIRRLRSWLGTVRAAARHREEEG